MAMLPNVGVDPSFAMPAPKPSGGMFGGGKFGLKEALAFGLAGLVSRRNPGLIQALMGAMLQKQQAARDAADYQQQRQDKRDDFVFEQDYRAAHPTAAQPTEYERMLEAAGYQPGTPDYLQHVRNYVNMRENPITMTPYGPMPYSSLTPQLPTQPVGPLTPIPDGGPSPSGSGGFRY